MKYFRRKTQHLRQNFLFGFLAVGLFLALSVSAFAALGDLDAGFGTGGKVSTTFNFGGARDIVLQADGKIVVVGSDSPGNSENIALARYHTDGSLDASFGNGGKVSTSVGQFNSASGIAIQADGRIVVAGEVCVFGPICDFVVVRYAPNGSLDTSFDGDGKVIIDMGNHNFGNDLAIQPDGKIVVVGGSGVAGSRNYAFAVARLNWDGSLDASFDGDGRRITSLGSYSDDGATAVVIQQDGKIIASGYRGNGSGFSPTDFALVRYNADGSLDTSFDGDGIVITDANVYDGFSDVAVQPDGNIVAVGNRIVRYKPDGSIDTSFGGGIVIAPAGISSVAIQSNGKIVAGGSSSRFFAIVRYNPNGSFDTTFGGGLVTTGFDDGSNPFSYGGVNGLAIQPDGKIVAAGFGGQDGEYSFFAVARYIGDAVISNRKFFDFDGDGKSDISVFRPSDGTWYLNRSTQGFSATQFGLSTDKLTPADFDGDGKTDISVFRDGVWYWLNSSNGNSTPFNSDCLTIFPFPQTTPATDALNSPFIAAVVGSRSI